MQNAQSIWVHTNEVTIRPILLAAARTQLVENQDGARLARLAVGRWPCRPGHGSDDELATCYYYYKSMLQLRRQWYVAHVKRQSASTRSVATP